MLKKITVGIENFKEYFSEDFYYVDKSLFIRELLLNFSEVNQITRPRRFGKTLNMSMLKCFFEIGSDTSLFDGLKISEEKDLCEKYMGKFPVISISLKSVDALGFTSAVEVLKNIIGKEASRFLFLSESEKLSDIEKNAYQRLIHGGTTSGSDFDMSDSTLLTSIQTLSQLLVKHYKQKVIILIDEYDVPLDKAFQHGYYDEMVTLIRNLLGNALKTNDSLYFAVMTGCLRISKESIFTGLNNLNVMTMSDPYYFGSFGFTEEEVMELLQYYGLEEYHDVIRDWYDGYQFGNTSVYCPWDVVKYVQALLRDKDAEPENYWANTSGNDLIRRLLKKANQNTKNDIEQLINDGSIIKQIRQELTYREVEDSIDNIWSVLYSTGYLTCLKKVPGRKLELALPNREVRELFVDLVKDWFEETTLSDSGRIQRFTQAFIHGDVNTIQQMLNDYLWDSISIRGRYSCHGMLLGLLQSQDTWSVRSNAESGEGYSDISIETPERNGIVIEVKYAEDGNLEKACREALLQIEEKKYGEGLKHGGMHTVLSYGISFYRKGCMVVKG